MSIQQEVVIGNIEIDPRVLTQILGSQMIQSDSIVIAEQIKNSIDAKADEVIVDLSKIEDDIIKISDNGNGMSFQEIKEKWLLVGTNNKTSVDSLLGGKGIGRLGLFRLADRIIVETTQDKLKHKFTFDKEKIENEGFRNIQIHTEQVNSLKNGTVITLKSLKKFIDLEEIEIGLENLNHPKTPKLYSIKYPNSYLKSEFILSDTILNVAPFKAEVKIEGTSIDYTFKCLIKNTTIYKNKVVENKLISKLNDFLTLRGLNDVNLGTINFSLANFYLHRPYLSWYGTTLNKVKNHFLQAYQGVSVYRNDYKIFGHGNIDWLKLAELRVERMSDNIDNKLTYGIITLDNKKSLSLEEDSSREGFIDSPELTYFREVISMIVKQFGLDRKKSLPSMNSFIKDSRAKVINTGESNTDDTHSDTYDNSSTSTSDTHSDTNDTGSTRDTHSDTSSTRDTDSDTNDNGTRESNTGETSSIRNRVSHKIGTFDNEILKNINSTKVTTLLKEISTINILNYPLATAFLYRSLLEISMDEYLLENLQAIKEDFKNYSIDEDKNIKLEITKNGNQIIHKDIPIGKKIIAFKTHLSKTTKIDKRSLNHLDDLRNFVDDINLAMHWNDKKIGINSLQTNWSNTIYFLEFLCRKI